jgi:hypothetical protein
VCTIGKTMAVGWVIEACDLDWILVGSLLDSNVLMSVSM